MIIYGRSDATLNPAGVRIGTAEIYRQVELLTQIKECLCIGQEWRGDQRVVLFVVMQDNLELDAELQEKIREKIRVNASARHVPGVIIAVEDVPKTINGKVSELAVRSIVHKEPVKNLDALANPKVLEYFKQLPELD